MTKIDVAENQAMIVSINELGSLQDPDTGETLKFEIANHDESHNGTALPAYTAKNKEGRVYTAEVRGDLRVFAGPKPDPYAEQKEASEDRNIFKEGKQTPDKFAKTDKELGLKDKEEDESLSKKVKNAFSDKDKDKK